MKKAKIVDTVHNGALKLEIREYADGRFGFDWQTDEYKRKQVRLGTKEAAEKKAEELLGATRAGTVDLLKIDPTEYAEFLRWKAERVQGGDVPTLVSDLLTIKQSEELSIWTLRDWKQLDKFAKAFPRNIDTITDAHVRKWLDKHNVGPVRWNNLLKKIKSLWRFARDTHKLGERKTPVEKIKPRKLLANIETYSPAEFRRLLDVVEPEWLPTIVLLGLVGVRPQECAPDPRDTKQPLQWANVMWEKQKLDVPKVVAKDGRRRFTPICDSAMTMLSPWRRAKGRIAPTGRLSDSVRRWVKELNTAGDPWRWKNDGLRHSYASYRLAIIKDIPQLSLEMGNSAKMIHDHYLDLKHEDEAAEWFASCRSERVANVVQMRA